jgi:hypothetical protein
VRVADPGPHGGALFLEAVCRSRSANLGKKQEEIKLKYLMLCVHLIFKLVNLKKTGAEIILLTQLYSP